MGEVLVTYIKPGSEVASNRYTLREMLLTAAGHGPKHQQYSSNFFEVKTLSTNPKPPSTMMARYSQKFQDLEFEKSYHHFRIPKRSGGTRQIKAPDEDLKLVQKEVADDLLLRLKLLPHNSAYAYTRGRCAYDALVTHQRANARWFLKIDLKDFFPSITPDVLRKTLPKLAPLNELTSEALEKLVDLATDEGSLPQGSPLSPILSNLVLVEFDKVLTQTLWRYKNQHYTYTRYADDMIITSPYTFKFEPIIELIKKTFKDLGLPFTIATHKTRYASMAGRNWNLGLMYTDQQRITVGTKKKRELHSLVNSFVYEYPWDLQSTQELLGKLSYLKNIEPDYYNTLVNKYNMKYNVDTEQMIHAIITGTQL